ncbi:molybdenum cofactor biosynthesis protein MoaE [Aquipuribacter hungaricus]|uniref:Molybdenum cofactor biosynthesis protein MoaE n=1 Tax=Aquipuribacter hungaricus TaxID=545624 RepID=A0ABV7WEP0_9MICO
MTAQPTPPRPGCQVVLAEVRGTPVSAAELAALVAGRDRGAVVTFDGVVRDHDSPGRGPVTLLDYEGHPSAGQVIADVVAGVAAGSRAAAVAVVHRTGPLEVGECALAVAVAASHRGDAFETAARLVDEVKERLPVWKHQHFGDGSDEWVGLGGLDA